MQELALTIRANYGMHCFERGAIVQWRASNTISQRIAQAHSFIKEEFCIVRRCQTLEEPSHLRRQTIIDLIAGRPKLENLSNSGRRRCEVGEHTVSPPVSGRVWIFNIA